MAYIPDEAALAMRNELTPAARDLFVYYCVRRNKTSGGFNCPKTRVLAELEGMTEPSYFRAKKELLKKGWIDGQGDFIKPIRGFQTIKNDTPQPGKTIKNDSPDSDETIKNDSGTIKNESPTIKNDSETIKNDSDIYKEVPAILPATLPDSITSQSIVQPEEPTAPEGGNLKPKKSRRKKSPRDAEKWSAEVQEVFEAWQTATNQPKTVLSDDRRDRIIARLEQGFTVERLKLCLDGWKLSPWHQGDNPSRKIYNKIETIFRDAEQVDSFISMVEQKPAQQAEPQADDGLPAKAPKPISFAEAMEMDFLIWRPDGDPREIFEEVKKNYLLKNPGEQFEAEVAAYELSDDFQQRLSEAGSVIAR